MCRRSMIILHNDMCTCDIANALCILKCGCIGTSFLLSLIECFLTLNSTFDNYMYNIILYDSNCLIVFQIHVL